MKSTVPTSAYGKQWELQLHAHELKGGTACVCQNPELKQSCLDTSVDPMTSMVSTMTHRDLENKQTGASKA